MSVRPEKVREAVFRSLGPDKEARVWLFAGSELGIEALSRTLSAVWCDVDERSMLQFRKTENWADQAGQYLAYDAQSAIRYMSTGPADIIFMDPPMSKGFMKSR